jgi:signal transduction histidine kinase
VADGCGGIPEADLPLVFITGWRGTKARTPGADGGTGLGLAIVRGIVDAHRGRVTVVNAGEGCRFEVRLPALASSSDVEQSAGEQPGSAPVRLLIPGL